MFLVGGLSDLSISTHNPFIIPLNTTPPSFFFLSENQNLLVFFPPEQTRSKSNYLQAQCKTPSCYLPWELFFFLKEKKNLKKGEDNK